MIQRTVLVTGCAGGIGAATARRFRGVDRSVIGLDRRPCPDDPDLDEFIKGDISSSAVWDRAAGSLSHGPGRLSALVNKAAIQLCRPLVETTLEEWDR